MLLAWSPTADASCPRPSWPSVRSRGWAASVAEREPGVASVSAPVLRDGVLLAALCVSGPVSRLGQAPGRKLSSLVVAAAAELSALR